MSDERNTDAKNDAPQAVGRFRFTRDDQVDYHFVFNGGVSREIETAVARIQDYFGSLVDGVGYYSFAVGDQWVVATTQRSSRVDPVGRAIFEIEGEVFPVGATGTAWYSFATTGRKILPGAAKSVQGGEFSASESALRGFLASCASHESAISWGYGVRSQRSDTTRIHFDVRFVLAKPMSWRSRLAKAIWRWMTGER